LQQKKKKKKKWEKTIIKILMGTGRKESIRKVKKISRKKEEVCYTS